MCQTSQCPVDKPDTAGTLNHTKTGNMKQHFEETSRNCPAVHRGDIYNIECGSTTPTGTEIWPGRPAVIVSNDAINEKSGFVTVVYLTTSPKRDMPYHTKVQSGKKIATSLCEQIFSVDKSRLGLRIGSLSDEELAEIDVALSLSLSTINTNGSKCTNTIRKWILALDKYHISLMGNPAEPDTDDEELRRLIIERDTWKNMYQQLAANMQHLIAVQV